MGFPIRTSADRCLVDGSPQLFAVTHVLHRFLAPRHPPLALRSLERTKLFVRARRTSHDKMLVLALQFSRCGPGASPEHRAQGSSSTESGAGRLPPTGRRLHRRQSFPTPSKRKRRQVRRFARAGEDESYEPARAGRRTHQCTNWVSRHRVIVRSPTMWNGLLRKEVIQPHLPVRLPCYDFTPITDPTFDGSLSCELGHRLRVLPTFVV